MNDFQKQMQEANNESKYAKFTLLFVVVVIILFSII